jgi:two-component system cell cycle sensor histidine kinase/response regulator CckA
MDKSQDAVSSGYAVRILIVEDDQLDAILMVSALRREGYLLAFDVVDTESAFRKKLATHDYDVILCDHNLRNWTGNDALIILQTMHKEVPFLVVTAALGDEAAVDYIKLGATDYVLKDRLERLPGAVWRALDARKQREINIQLQAERERLEEQFLQAQKLEAVGRLAGGIAHDFNNILGVILGYGELLLKQDDLSAKASDRVQQMVEAAKSAASLTRQLLAFSGKQIVQNKVFNLNDVVSGTQEMLTRVIGENIEVTTNLQASLATIKADPAQIQQVLMNLVVNARDAMPAGGRIAIETSNVTPLDRHLYREAGAREGHYVLLSVGDTGCGMDNKVMAHLFEPFFTTKEKGMGTGLGLSTVFGIVEQSGGKIFVTSEPGKGSTFRIYFPTADPVASELLPPEAPNLAGSETILLVEDEPELRRVARLQLESKGYRVLESMSPENAIQIAEAFPGSIDLLLTDVVMPGMGGPEVATRVRQIRPGTRVLYVTGYSDAVVGNRGLQDNASVLQKPFTREELVKKIQEVVSQSPPAAASQTTAA